jgi:phytoene dehydrogenase-like protein
VALLLGSDVLVGHQVHAISCRRDKAYVGDGVESDQLIKGDRLVHEVDWHELDGTELAVDASNKFVDNSAEILVLLDILARGNGDLYEDNLANPLRVLGKEDLESVQLLGHTLDVVQAVDTDNELDALELLLERCDTFLDLGLL